MATKRNEMPRLSDAQLAEMMALMKGSDSVELKLTVATEEHRATIAGLPIDPVEAEPRQAFFFDTPDLTLDKAGLVVRARRIQGGRGDTVIKLRPVVPSELPAAVRQSVAFKTEVDAMPGGFVASGSMKGRSTAQEIQEAVQGTRALRKIFSKEQRAFYAEHAPEGVDFEDLVPARADIPPQADLRAEGAAAQIRGGDVALPGRLAHPGAVDQGPAGGRVPGGGGGACIPGIEGRGPERRPADEDANRPDLLQEPAEGRREKQASAAAAAAKASATKETVACW